jgi:deazaflavin-dependent oxidoreductase (nitroreductase family)
VGTLPSYGVGATAKIAHITTVRMRLRPITIDDVDELVALDADPEVMRYLTGGKPTSRDAMIDTVHRAIGSRWVAFDRSTDEFVGWFGLAPTADDEYEIGYRLKRVAWNHGFATEGTRALIDLAFSRLGARRLWAQTMAVNRRSRAVMERCGLRYARRFHPVFDDPIEGTELGEVEYELLRAEWEAAMADSESPARYVQPGWFTRNVFNPVVAFLTRMGVSVWGSRELRVRGRTSGQWRSTPVNLLSYDAKRYLVAPRGETQWVRNLRVAGEGELRVGRRVERFRAVEIEDANKVPILRAYLKRWKAEVGVFFSGVSADSPEADVRGIASDHPVFQIEPNPPAVQ